MKFRILILCSYLLLCQFGYSQEIPGNQVIEPANLYNYLKEDVKENLNVDGNISQVELAKYLREKYSERYFYDWKKFNKRFEEYNLIYTGSEKNHIENALDHLSKYSDSTNWVLPFNYLNGKPVNAYAIRHLERQHKMVDIAFYYYYMKQDQTYLTYFKRQLQSLNTALDSGLYEKIEDGNGVYEVFRTGYRVLNWLQIHSMFLGQENYTDEDQLITIATLLQHGANLYAENSEFTPGNHQTRGMSALAMISIILKDFKGTDEWYRQSMKLLEEHLSKEINDDGFQFERSVHYHISDIENYYYVYQLAKISGIKVNVFWEEKLKSLFTTLTKIGYPDKSAPVLQDDTNNPWAEKNDISGALTLGYLLFEDPTMGYFASNEVEAKMYWYLSDQQLMLLKDIKKKQPDFKSLSFPTTGYFVQRDGWDPNDQMMIISAGVDAEKPDHQHGDILGIQAMANGKAILPNYQVRYSLEDLELFKNSMVKNVALVDDELQGKKYKSNQGGSGFGKFVELPKPIVITWNTSENLDLFVGSHNGFENVGVNYSRQVIHIKNDFWIVKDNFKSQTKHTYKQVWQGHYTFENGPDLIRATFDDAAGLDIFQLNKIDDVKSSGARGKQWSVISKNEATIFSFITVIFPYVGYDNRINELDTTPQLKGWKTNNSVWKAKGEDFLSLSKKDETYFFGVKQLSYQNIKIEFSKSTDVYVKLTERALTIQLLGDTEIQIATSGLKEYKSLLLKPGNILKCRL
ncbi:MAG: heparinase II/III family protein [Flavobacteriaceae bacterium]|nr:heparinase II/III family protein [Flavobacteriaceae bacterium]